jgi:hypothetical protein
MFQTDDCYRFVLILCLMVSVTAAFVCACLSYIPSFCVFNCGVFSCAFLSLFECKSLDSYFLFRNPYLISVHIYYLPQTFKLVTVSTFVKVPTVELLNFNFPYPCYYFPPLSSKYSPLHALLTSLNLCPPLRATHVFSYQYKMRI